MEESLPTQKNFAREGEGKNSEGEVEEEPLEDAIPDLPENAAAREFLKKAPKKGLWLPMGKEVKVMQCWRCKAYGHRTGDRECPLSVSGNIVLDIERQAREDPMSKKLAAKQETRAEKYERVAYLMKIVEEIRQEEKKRKREKMTKKEHKHKKKVKRSHRDNKDER